MTFTAIILLLIALLFFVFTRTTYVYIYYEKKLQLEFHFVIFSFILKYKEKNKSRSQITLGFYSALIKSLLSFSESAEIRVSALRIASHGSGKFERLFPVPYGIGALISMLFAYLDQKAKKITLDDDAVILTPDAEETVIKLKLYTEFYNLAYLLFKILLDLKKHRKKRKFLYVGN